MLTCLIEGIKRATTKAVNYDKIKEITQGPDENPCQDMETTLGVHQQMNG